MRNSQRPSQPKKEKNNDVKYIEIKITSKTESILIAKIPLEYGKTTT